MKQYEVIITEPAQRDLVLIYRYIFYELYSMQGAKHIAQELQDMIEGLNIMPERYPLSLDERLNALSIRIMPVGNYHVFYRVVDNSVIVVRVMYGRRNYGWEII